MKKNSFGHKLYLSVLGIFLIFAAAFIFFQRTREKQFKIETLELKLQDFNSYLAELLPADSLYEEKLEGYVCRHATHNMRVTLIRPDGTVVYDNKYKNYASLANHSNRKEVREALKKGAGSTVDRRSKTLKTDFFYSATYFPDHHIIVRSALPYNSDLTKSLQTDRQYIWFALAAIIVLTIVLYRFTNRLGENINKLSIFASRASHNESLETEDLAVFPDDELGEIAERIIKIYKQLQSTRQEQDVLKRELTQNISHELKTPVASIQGYIETILDNPQISEETRHQFLENCYAQTKRLTALLLDISTLNRMDHAPEPADKEMIDINKLTTDILAETALQLQQHSMTFRNLLPEGIQVEGVRSLIYSIFRNLTDNAIAYAGEGTAVTLSATKDKTHWHFTFMDNGVGVGHEHLARLFERFYRVDKGRSRKLGGTGLGLAIVKNAVLKHGGTISVRNNEGGGLRFDFSLRA
ncbi:MAG: ATP-binding protein [Prevotella sp.]|nr:ATP-binding protein [Prevotella sp.]